MRIFLLVAALIFSLEAKSLFSNSDQKESAQYINALKDLVIATQKTRGLTNSYLNGNKSNLLLIHGTKRDMKKAIGTMESLPLSSTPVISKRSTSISEALISLNSKAFKMKSDVAFDGYTEQIEQILMLAQTVSKQHSSDLNPLGKEASAIMMETILPLTEQIGKMRGMGSGIVASGKINETQKFSLVAMLSEISDLDSKLQSSMRDVIYNHKEYYTANVQSELALIQKSIVNYSSLTKNQVLNASASVSSDEYFTKGTDIISSLLKVFNANNKAIIADSKGWI